jgi:hypothetical protein
MEDRIVFERRLKIRNYPLQNLENVRQAQLKIKEMIKNRD